ncbi:6-phosphogluconolactonase [Alishewanella longhuensis]|uniref:6-phosphogluconolactonase n=1 Tax=Alishewanella longhuensis TaxID=1091037 RepID=A0ABQ3L9K3_9ALTE|nr:6-phosphogluconolactonase [Alishewanella longhuensis]GHG74599.1 6-phosphogluconolactonase [Alishewanella longhuensis]
MHLLHQFSDSSALNHDFASKLVAILTTAIAERDAAYLVVSGGRTPQALFQTLASTPLSWEKVTILLADDRYLPVDSEQSNERLVKATLLQHYAAKAKFISLYAEAEHAFAAIPEILPRVAGLPTFDAVILGMGEDGHTASLFPCSAQLTAGLSDTAPAVLATEPTSAPFQRISLSKTRLLDSRHIFLHLVGENKFPVLQQALANTDPVQMPIRAFLHHPSVAVDVMYSPK